MGGVQESCGAAVDVLASIPKNEFQNMTDVISPLLEQKKVVSFPIHEFWINIGKIEDFQHAYGEFKAVFGK